MIEKQLCNCPRPLLVALLVMSLASGCAAKLTTVSPKSINFSGTWQIDPGGSDEVLLRPGASRGEFNSARETNDRIGRGRNGGTSGPVNQAPKTERLVPKPRGLITKPPVMTATQMTIEQDNVSMGISYPGEVYRDLDWGKVERRGTKTNAGWNGNVLIVRTDSEEMNFSETYSLDQSGRVLTIELFIDGNQGNLRFKRVFNRKSGQ